MILKESTVFFPETHTANPKLIGEGEIKVLPTENAVMLQFRGEILPLCFAHYLKLAMEKISERKAQTIIVDIRKVTAFHNLGRSWLTSQLLQSGNFKRSVKQLQEIQLFRKDNQLKWQDRCMLGLTQWLTNTQIVEKH